MKATSAPGTTISGITDGEGIQNNNGSFISAPLPLSTVEGRLTLTTAVPVTTGDVTSATTMYFTPYGGDRISLYDGTRWKAYKFTEISLALGTLTAAKPYDVFIYDNSGTLTLEFLVWTNATTRATALVLQNGVYVKSGATTRRYLGTFYTASTTTTEDSATKRYLYNYYNRVTKLMVVNDTANSWTYTTATWRQANANTANKVEFVIGVDEEPAEASVAVTVVNATVVNGAVGIGLDTTTDGNFAQIKAGFLASYVHIQARGSLYTGIGYHYLSWNEYSDALGATTWYGDNGSVEASGMLAFIKQ